MTSFSRKYQSRSDHWGGRVFQSRNLECLAAEAELQGGVGGIRKKNWTTVVVLDVFLFSFDVNSGFLHELFHGKLCEWILEGAKCYQHPNPVTINTRIITF